MERGTYKGKNERLKGETALIRRDESIPGYVRAQFDNIKLDETATSLEECVAHSWTWFCEDDFDIKEI